MFQRKKREQWLQDIEARQRNIVFPDTVNNEARFWRNVIDGKHRLTTIQRVGVGLFCLMIAGVALLITFPLRFGPGQSTFSWSNLLAGGFDWLIGLGVLGAFLLIFRLSQKSSRK
jgi:hypothetical protein